MGKVAIPLSGRGRGRELDRSHAAESLLALDSLLFAGLKNFLVLDSKLATADIVSTNDNTGKWSTSARRQEKVKKEG
jgi:hypothetical protein